MGRPKGSKNKPKAPAVTLESSAVPESPFVEKAATPAEIATAVETAQPKVKAGSFLDVDEAKIRMIAKAIVEASSPVRQLHSETPAEGTKVYCRIPHEYMPGKKLMQGQVVPLAGAVNDEKLVRLGYLVKYDKSVHGALVQCGKCGEQFIGGNFLQGHGDKIHPMRERGLTPMQEDQQATQQDERILKQTPPFLEKTAASLKA